MNVVKYSKYKIILLLTICLVITNAQIIKLYDKVHFYELAIERHDEVKGLNLIQSFSYHINGEDKCAPKISEPIISRSFQDSDDSYGAQFNLKVETLIYSNYEQTMSFLIQLTFKSIRKINNVNVQGFEIVFQSPFDNQITCVQIVPDSEDFIKTLSNKFKLTIKDPAFLSQNEKYFLFHFGKVSIRALVDCDSKSALIINEKKLCALDISNSESIPIGIRSEVEVLPDPLKADTCPGHVLAETCIMRYSALSVTPDPYIIIIHPMPDDFVKMISDLDFLSLDKDQKLLLEDAKRNGQLTVKIGNHEYLTDSLYIEGGVKLVHHIESYDHQRLPKGIVIKLVIHSSDYVNFVSFFNESKPENSCNRKQNEPLGCYCATSQQCNNCYHQDQLNDKSKGIEFIPLNYDETNTKIPKNKICRTKPFFRPYNFDAVKMEVNFQKQKLSNYRGPVKKDDTLQFFNREFLPRLCFNMNYGKSSNYFNLNIIFHDHYQTGLSSLIHGTTYEFTLYSYEYSEVASYYDNYRSDDLFKVNSKMVLKETRNINLNDQFEIKNLIQSKYILEVVPIQDINKCPVGYCIDESTRNNEIHCIKCNKLIVLFVLEDGMLSGSNPNVAHSTSNNKINRLNIRAETTVKKANLSFDPNVVYKCSKDNALFENSLLQSLNLSDSTNKITLSYKADKRIREVKDYREILSAKVPGHLNLDSFYLPFIKLNHKSYEAPFIIDLPEKTNVELYVILLPIFTFILLIIVLSLYIHFKAKNDMLKKNYKKRVTFYLSIDVDKNIQQDLKRIIEPYMKVLRKNFRQMHIELIDYKMNSKVRKHLIETSNLIVYVCCTNKEIRKLREPMKIGQNDFHHDYNLIHFYDKYQKKCLNVTFNMNINEKNTLDSTYYNQMKSENIVSNTQPAIAHFQQHISENNLSFVILPSASIESSTNESMSSSLFSNIQHSGNSVYLKLPKQNQQFLAYLFELNKNTNLNITQFSANDSSSISNFKTMRKKLNDIPFNILMYRINTTLTNLVKKQLKKNKTIVNLEQNINFDDQPYEEESIFEDSDDESASFIEDTSQTSSNRSNQVQFDSIDETSSLMPIS